MNRKNKLQVLYRILHFCVQTLKLSGEKSLILTIFSYAKSPCLKMKLTLPSLLNHRAKLGIIYTSQNSTVLRSCRNPPTLPCGISFQDLPAQKVSRFDDMEIAHYFEPTATETFLFLMFFPFYSPVPESGGDGKTYRHGPPDP